MVGDSILLERVEKDSLHLIALPQNAKVESFQDRFEFVVISVGPGRYTDRGELIPPPVSVGDKVLAVTSKGIGWERHGRHYVAIETAAIIGVVNEEVEATLEQQFKIGLN